MLIIFLLIAYAMYVTDDLIRDYILTPSNYSDLHLYKGGRIHPNDIICLNNQFFHIIQFPELAFSYTSININGVLGNTAHVLQLNEFYKRIHPDEYAVVFYSINKAYQLAYENHTHIQPLECFIIMEFKLQHANGNYIKVLNQNCVLSNKENKFELLSMYTDISNLKNSQTQTSKLPSFSKREEEVLLLLTQGKSSSEIGCILNISKHTVDTHRRNMLCKSNFNNTTELIAFCLSNKILK